MSSSEDHSFQQQLGDRIRMYAEQLEAVEKRLVELNDTLLTTQQRLDAALEMYRLEFDGEPPVAGIVMRPPAVAIQSGRRSPTARKRRLRSSGPSWNDALEAALREAGEPLHINELWDRMEASGFKTESKTPRQSLAAMLVRNPEIVRTGRSIYGLAEWSQPTSGVTPTETQLDIDHAPEQAHNEEQEAVAWST